MSTIKHTHTFLRAKVSDGNKIWFMCSLPNCRYREQKPFLLGKTAMCSCGEIFILTPTSLNKARPTCLNCVESNKNRRKQEKEIVSYSNTNNLVYDLFRAPIEKEDD